MNGAFRQFIWIGRGWSGSRSFHFFFDRGPIRAGCRIGPESTTPHNRQRLGWTGMDWDIDSHSSTLGCTMMRFPAIRAPADGDDRQTASGMQEATMTRSTGQLSTGQRPIAGWCRWLLVTMTLIWKHATVPVHIFCITDHPSQTALLLSNAPCRSKRSSDPSPLGASPRSASYTVLSIYGPVVLIPNPVTAPLAPQPVAGSDIATAAPGAIVFESLASRMAFGSCTRLRAIEPGPR